MDENQGNIRIGASLVKVNPVVKLGNDDSGRLLINLTNQYYRDEP